MAGNGSEPVVWGPAPSDEASGDRHMARPLMVVGRSTSAGDLVRRLGWANVFAHHEDRYPRLALGALDGAGADAVLLPDEPYVVH